jgi:hypothetical protein
MFSQFLFAMQLRARSGRSVNVVFRFERFPMLWLGSWFEAKLLTLSAQMGIPQILEGIGSGKCRYGRR